MPVKPMSDSSMKFFRFMPYSAATKVPAPRPSVKIEKRSSSSISELRLASRMALTLERSQPAFYRKNGMDSRIERIGKEKERDKHRLTSPRCF